MPKPKRELKFEAVEGYCISTFTLTRSENQSPKKELEEPALEAFALPIFEKVSFILFIYYYFFSTFERSRSRKGGVSHGPVPRSHAIQLPRKVRM